jgi:hypothetical protein
MATDAKGLSPCCCPVDHTHNFKALVTMTDQPTSRDMWCPYCGHKAEANEFMPLQMERARAAMTQAAEQYMQAKMQKAVGDAFRNVGRSGGSGLRFEFRPSAPIAPQPLPEIEVEPTRRAMTCSSCTETFAVYGLATYCPNCGQLAPVEQFVELIRVQRDRIAMFDRLDPELLQQLTESGVVASAYDGSIKDGFGALETYLKNRFRAEATGVVKPPSSTTFQRLDDANSLYKAHLSVDLESLAGVDTWAALHRAAAVRHVLVHNAGVIDEMFLNRRPDWHQQLGQRVIVNRDEASAFLVALDEFVGELTR